MSGCLIGILTFAMVVVCTIYEIDPTWPTVGLIFSIAAVYCYLDFYHKSDDTKEFTCSPKLRLEDLYKDMEHLEIENYPEVVLDKTGGRLCILVKTAAEQQYLRIYKSAADKLSLQVVEPDEEGKAKPWGKPGKLVIDASTEVAFKLLEEMLTNYLEQGSFFKLEED